jgi:zinc protease
MKFDPPIHLRSTILTPFFLIAFCFLEIISSFSADSRSSMSLPIHIHDFRTSQGATSWVVSNHHLPIVSVHLCFQQSGDKSDQRLGTATLLSLMLSEGCGEWSSQAFKELLLEQNIQLNVTCDMNHVHIEFRTLKAQLKKAMEIVTIMLKSPRFDPEEFKKVLQQYQGQLSQSLHDEKTVAMEETLKFALGAQHPYACSTQDILKQLPQVTMEDLKKHLRYLAQDQLFAAVCGDVTLEEWKILFDSFVQTLPAQANCPTVAPISIQKYGETHRYQMDIPQSLINFVLPALNRKDPDFYAAQVLNSLFGGTYFISRLWDSIREKTGYAYYIMTQFSLTPHGEWMMGRTATATKTVSKVIDLIEKERLQLLSGSVEEASLKEHKDHLMGEYQLNFSSTQSVVAILAAAFNLGLSKDEVIHRNQNIEKVTLADVKRVAKRILETKPVVVIVGRDKV